MVENGFDIDWAIAAGELIVKGRNEKSIFAERSFITANRLITVDAPDGSGKGAIALRIQQQLSLKYGSDNVLLVYPNKFDQSPSALEIYTKLKNQPDLSLDSVHHNLHYMAASMLNYKTVISPALESGKIVVVDSSEIRLLAFMFDRGSEEAINSTLRWIKRGRVTNNILAGNRVLIKVEPGDCLANINARGKKDYGDPVDLSEAKRRANCYTVAIKVLKGLKQDHPTNWIAVDNPRIETSDIGSHLDQLVSEKVIPRLNI